MNLTAEPFMQDLDPHGPALADAAQGVLSEPGAKADALKQLLKQLPQVRPSRLAIDRDRVTVGRAADLNAAQAEQLKTVLTRLKPWRKGPFDFFGIRIDSEWNSAMKWRRVAPHIKPLRQRKILDVGSSNGYYLFRAAAAQPQVILGIEPYTLYYYQYLALTHYLRLPGCHTLPLKLEDLPAMDAWFDTILCMGILYHRRSPLDTLARLRRMLAHGGELVLETLIVPGEDDTALSPKNRYARMRNVFFIPTVPCLKNWLGRCGYSKIRCVDVTPTTFEEQRKTPWIDSESLDSFLDPGNNEITVEGYPAPIRAVFVAEP